MPGKGDVAYMYVLIEILGIKRKRRVMFLVARVEGVG
jgi:hypothetical protein